MEIGPFPDKNGPCQVPFKGQTFKGSSGIGGFGQSWSPHKAGLVGVSPCLQQGWSKLVGS